MIDFKKLEKAFSLAEKADAHLHVGVSNRLKPITTHTKDIVMQFKDDNGHKPYGSIDHVIEALEEHLKPKPKFQLNDIVWFNNKGNIGFGKVYSIISSVMFFYHVEGSLGSRSEEDLYPTREEAIKHQIAHWTKMLEEEE